MYPQQANSNMQAVNPNFQQNGGSPGNLMQQNQQNNNAPNNYTPYQSQYPEPQRRSMKPLLTLVFLLAAGLVTVIVLSLPKAASATVGGANPGFATVAPVAGVATRAPVVGIPVTTNAPTAGALATVLGEFTVNSQIVGNTLTMELSVAKSVGWMAVGLGGSHGAVDSVHCSFNAAGTATAIDSHQTAADGLSAHRSDISNDVTIVASSQNAGLSLCRFSRPLNTGDTAGTPDVILAASQVVTAAVAYGTGPIAIVTPGAAMAYAKHTYYTKGAMTMPVAAVLVTSAPTPLGAITLAPVAGIPPVGGGGQITTVVGEFTVKSTVTAGVLQMELSVAKAVGWMAIGFGGAHGEYDSIHCSFGAANAVYDTYCTAAGGPNLHLLDVTPSDVTLVTAATNAALTTCTFSRPMNTGDTRNDVILTVGQLITVGLGYGLGPINADNGLAYLKHTSTATGGLTL